MIFERSWVLIFLLLPLACAGAGGQPGPDRAGLQHRTGRNPAQRKFCAAVNAQVLPGVHAVARSPQNQILAQHPDRRQFVFRQGRSPGDRKPFVQEKRVMQSEVWRH